MSITSDVTLILGKQVYENMKEDLSKNNNLEGLELITKRVDNICEDNKFVSLNWSHIKWHTKYDNVDQVEDYLGKIRDEFEDRYYDKDERIENDEILDKYAFEFLQIKETGGTEFYCYDLECTEGDVFLMPDLYANIVAINQMKEKKQYVVNELTVLTDNQFEIYNECHLVTDSLYEASKLAETLMIDAINQLGLTKEDVETFQNKEMIKSTVSTEDGYNRIEVTINIF